MDVEELKQHFDLAVEKKDEAEAIIFGGELFSSDPIHTVLGFKKLSSDGMAESTLLYGVFTLRLAKATRSNPDLARKMRSMNLNELVEASRRLNKLIENTEFEYAANAQQTYNSILDEISCWDNIKEEPTEKIEESKSGTFASKLKRAKEAIQSLLH